MADTVPNEIALTLTGDELADIAETLAARSQREHNAADEILRDETKSGEVRATEARGRRQRGNRYSELAKKIHKARETLWALRA